MANQQTSDAAVPPQGLRNQSASVSSPVVVRTEPPAGNSNSKASPTATRLTPKDVAKRLNELNTSGVDSNEAIAQVVNVVAGAVGAFGVVYLSRSTEHVGRLAIRPDHFTPSHLTHLRSLLQHVARLGAVAAAEVSPQAGKAEGEDLLVVAVPVLKNDGEGNESLCAVIGIQSEEQARSAASYLTQVLTWTAAYIGKGVASSGGSDEVRNQNPSGNERSIFDVLRRASAMETFEESASMLADWVKRQTKCAEVVLGFRRPWRGCYVAAYTGAKSMDRRSRRLGAFREILEETTIAAKISADSSSFVESDFAAKSDLELDEAILQTSATKQLARETGLAPVERIPLIDANGEPYGAVLCLNPVNTSLSRPIGSDERRLFGQQVRLLHAGQRNSIAKWLGLHRLGKRWYRHPVMWASILATIALMLIPMPLQVHCKCQVQPKQRRFISVPYEGRLEEVLTEPGAIVLEDQLLARMDGHDIGLEISSLTAELRKAEKDYDTALAGFDRAQSQMAALEAKRLQLKIDALNERLGNLEIRSPVDGVVIGGDPRKLEGARLSMGETLLEVGPMDEMIVELEVLDEDVSHVELQQHVQYRLDALPWSKLQGKIELIHPQSEAREANNVFIAEVNLRNKDERLRPGMRGQAKIRAAHHPLGWNLFHKAWDGFVSWIAW